MLRSDKERLVAELTDRLKTTETLIVADYRGLSVPEIDELRGKLLEHGARFSVVKNTLTKRAAEAAGVDALLALLDGPTAIAFLESDGDPVATAKALDDAARSEVLVIKGGILDGAEIAADDVKRLAKLPPADTLRAQLVGALAGSLTTVVGLFAAPMRDIVGVIDARIRQLEEQGGADAPVRGSGPGEGAPGEPGGSPVTTEESSEQKAEAEPVADEAPAEEPPAEEPADEAEPEAQAEEPAPDTESGEAEEAEQPAAETQEGEEQ